MVYSIFALLIISLIALTIIISKMNEKTRNVLLTLLGLGLIAWLIGKNKKDRYTCPRCNYPILKMVTPCPNCGQPIKGVEV